MRKISRIAIEDWEDKPTEEKVAGVLGVSVLQCYSWGGRGAGNCSTVATVARGLGWWVGAFGLRRFFIGTAASALRFCHSSVGSL